MTRDIAKDSVFSIIEQAFVPLVCSAEFEDRGNKVIFRVFDCNGEPLLNVNDLTTQRLQDKHGMKSIINHSRDNLIKRGYELDSWQF